MCLQKVDLGLKVRGIAFRSVVLTALCDPDEIVTPYYALLRLITLVYPSNGESI